MNASTECGFYACSRAEYQLALNVFAVYLFRGGLMIIFDIKRYRNRAVPADTPDEREREITVNRRPATE